MSWVPACARASISIRARSGGSASSTRRSRTLNWANSRDLAPNQRWPTTQFSSCSVGIAFGPSVVSRASSSERPTVGLLFVVVARRQQEPEEAARVQGEQIGELADARKARVADHLDRVAADELGQVELHRLCGAGEIVDAHHDVILIATDVGEDPRIRGRQRLV